MGVLNVKVEPTPKSLSSLIFNFFTPDPPTGGNSLKINELFKVPFRRFRGFLLFGVDSKLNFLQKRKSDV